MPATPLTPFSGGTTNAEASSTQGLVNPTLADVFKKLNKKTIFISPGQPDQIMLVFDYGSMTVSISMSGMDAIERPFIGG